MSDCHKGDRAPGVLVIGLDLADDSAEVLGARLEFRTYDNRVLTFVLVAVARNRGYADPILRNLGALLFLALGLKRDAVLLGLTFKSREKRFGDPVAVIVAATRHSLVTELVEDSHNRVLQRFLARGGR
jgi:hypothetical protein